MNIESLNNEFAIEKTITFDEKSNGQVVVKINNAYAEAEIMLQGAHLIHWQPVNEEPVIWLSNEAVFAKSRSIRGGVPVCWPWFGAHETENSFPAHGYARTVLWQPVNIEQLSDGRTQLVFKIAENSNIKKYWPHDTELEIQFIIGAELKINLITKNTGSEFIILTEALHTYFNVGDVSKISISGLEGCSYLDKPDNFAIKKQTGMIDINKEVDRVYIDTTADIVITDPVLQRRIVINKESSRSTVVWNPWKAVADKMADLGKNGYLSMVCIESANAASNAFFIAPDDTHSLKVSYSVDALSD
jgi:glucose-6-phosphate 1-epimerase